MQNLSEILMADKIIRIGTIISGISIFFILTTLLFFFRGLPPIVPVYNQMPWGEDRLGGKLEIFIPLILTFVFFIVNLVFALLVYKKMPLISRTLSITGLLIIFLTMIFTFRTIQLIY